MTCIVGVVHEGAVWMGGDSAAVTGWNLDLTAEPKVFGSGAFLIGYTTSYRMGHLLQFGWEPPAHPEGISAAAFMRTGFVDSVRARFVAGGFAKVENTREEGGSFLVGYRGDLYEVGSDFSVLRSARGYAAIGSGAPMALGAMAATDGDLRPYDFLERALNVAEDLCIGVRGPFTILRLAPDGSTA